MAAWGIIYWSVSRWRREIDAPVLEKSVMTTRETKRHSNYWKNCTARWLIDFSQKWRVFCGRVITFVCVRAIDREKLLAKCFILVFHQWSVSLIIINQFSSHFNWLSTRLCSKMCHNVKCLYKGELRIPVWVMAFLYFAVCHAIFVSILSVFINGKIIQMEAVFT